MQTKVQQPARFVYGAGGLLCLCLCLVCSTALADGQSCRVVQTGKQFELQSPLFVYRLDASDGLRALSWENRLTGHEITLGKGPELEVDLGELSFGGENGDAGGCQTPFARGGRHDGSPL